MNDKGAELLRQLPHQYPMRLVDAVLELDDKHIKAVKNVTINEPFFKGHFPGVPLMPGVLIVEALAQASTILSMNIDNTDKKETGALGLLARIDKARFRRPVVPGDRLILESRWVSSRRGCFNFEAVASVDGELVAEAQLTSVTKSV